MASIQSIYLQSIIVSVLFVLAVSLVVLLGMMVWTTVGRRFWQWFTRPPEAGRDSAEEAQRLVDELAEALNRIVALTNVADSTGIPPYLDGDFDEIMKAALAAIARHQKEMGDA